MRKWTKRHYWQEDPVKFLRRGRLTVYEAADWKPDTDFNPRESITAFAVIADPEEKKTFLVHKVDDGKPSWGLPGGGIELAQNENPEEGIFREVLWESGYKIYRDESGRLTGADAVLDQQVTAAHKRMIFFSLLSMKSPRAPIRETEEIDEGRWFALREILAMPNFPHDPALAESRRDYIKETHVGYIIGALSLRGYLEEFGLQEASQEDLV